jgi:4-amino-4-deoxy-L-arabinose transferase-like glycosyltransferase
LLLACVLVLLVLAALRPLAVPDEGRYGEVGRWMLVSGDWLTPRLNGLPFFHKPPLLHWLDAISLTVFGVNAWALRLVPALHASLMLGLMFVVVRRWAGEALARLALIMLGSSLGFLVGGQYVNHDMVVATWIGVAIWCFALAFEGRDRPDVWLARAGFVASALAMLSKGLIGIALPGLVMLVWLVWTRQLRKVLYLPWITGLGLWSALALPWFVMAQQRYPDFFNYMFVGQQFNRYTAATYNNPQPWWFYLLALALLLFPWCVFALAQARRQAKVGGVAELPATLWRLCWAWLLAILLFFSIPHSKLVGYIIPVLPALAVLAAAGWQRAMAHRARAGRWFGGLLLLNLVLAGTLVLLVGGVTRKSRSQDVAAVLACAASPADTIFVSGGYPYDLPFYAQTQKPLVVVQDWPSARQKAGDGWQRELFEGADFDAQAAQALQGFDVLDRAAAQPGSWLVIPQRHARAQQHPGWVLHYAGAGWDLYQSGGGSAAKSPEAAEHKGLAGCRH